ncbi:U32 family peptidase [Pseudoflavonifractor phocaeensis]|uniref:U32 family peptidase n=1 Tax=Pseudoflavonifractor phocaeensis TaxID=1870988 RepID=UPI00195AB1C3|nr:U32 family peptidase [Pseudoflavonifractor phocaeensis]MBM6724484.1 U32 family peptidase [Pseudoflavonifractor phocaeensis]
MLELLAPAGSMEAVAAAVQNGADAVYLGYGDFNARRNAKNFSQEEFAAAVSYCHVRGTKVYLTLNTLLTDRELPRAAEFAAQASALGADAVLVQDMGVVRLLRQVAPDLPVHASTQMTLHNLDGVKMAAELGMTRAVLSRELSRDQIEYICQRSPIEIEVFAHGALCMCYSGQCFLSSVIGGRSGNRGLCAQPCRLKYGWGDKADSNPLSLKDLSLAGHLRELRKMGVACVKLEGRMKRPEYVAVVTGIYSRAIKENREPTAEELEQLRAAFSRQGFTQGYYLDQQGPDMFGVREEEKEPKELFAMARNTYQSGEAQRVPVTFYAMLRPGEPTHVGVEDPQGRVVTVEGQVPETARTRALTAEAVETQLSRTGGTPYRCVKVRSLVEEGLSLPLAALNALRREALDGLTKQREQLPQRRQGEFHPGARYENRKEPPALTISVRTAEQVTGELLALGPAMVYIPLEELAAHPEKAQAPAGTKIGVTLPRVAWDREMDQVTDQLRLVRDLGITDALIGNLGMAPVAQKLGFTLRGDFGLEVYNSQAVKEYKRLGFSSLTLSFELKFPQLRDISKSLDTELITYGRLPLMLMESCIIKNRTGSCNCQNTNILTDRKGARFPVVKAPGCRNELLNSQKLFLADKAADYRRIGLWAQRLLFTTENPRECVQVTQRYLNQGSWSPNEYTRGLYYRDVE